MGAPLRSAKVFVLTVAFVLASTSLASTGVLGQGAVISLEVNGNDISISTSRMHAAISLADGSLEVGRPGQNPFLCLDFPMLTAFDAPVLDTLALEDSRYTSDLSKKTWSLVSSKTSSSQLYGEYAEVVIETDIDLVPNEIPEQNPYVPVPLPVTLPNWGSFRVRFLVIEKNVTFPAPGGGTYDITGLSEVKVDLGIILGSEYSPESLCVKQRLTLTNQSLRLGLLTPGGELDLSRETANSPVPMPVIDMPERWVGIRSKAGELVGNYNWVGYSEAGGAPSPVNDFFMPVQNGLELYFCYDVAGSTEIWHDPSVSVSHGGAGTIAPVPNILSGHRAILLATAIAAGVILTAASLAARAGKTDPLDLEKNYYYRKKQK